jgi:FkbM family methyltransferase
VNLLEPGSKSRHWIGRIGGTLVLKALSNMGLKKMYPGEQFIWVYPHSGMLTQHREEFLNDLILTPGKSLVDVGANVGAWAIRASRFYEHVYAFEPNRTFFGGLERNIRLNHCNNTEAFNIALGDTDGYTSQTIMTHGKKGADSVPTRRLDSFQLNPSILKVDVEGTGDRVLKGALRTIASSHPTIILETHSQEERLEGGIIQELLPDYVWKTMLREYPENRWPPQLFLIGEFHE